MPAQDVNSSTLQLFWSLNLDFQNFYHISLLHASRALQPVAAHGASPTRPPPHGTAPSRRMALLLAGTGALTVVAAGPNIKPASASLVQFPADKLNNNYFLASRRRRLPPPCHCCCALALPTAVPPLSQSPSPLYPCSGSPLTPHPGARGAELC